MKILQILQILVCIFWIAVFRGITGYHDGRGR